MTQVSERILILDGTLRPTREQVGNKAASIAEMRALGMPVPPAFVLPIDECRRYHSTGRRLEEEAWEAVRAGIAHLERETARAFGDPAAPLLVSVRSGAAVSMPGMMDTVLNLGMTDAVERGLAELSGDPGFARETHARFCHDFGHIVLGADVEVSPTSDPASVRAAVLEDAGEPVPTDPWEQLRAAILAVFASWSSRRAIAYRRHWGIPEDGGTAVTVQAMVFGNLGGRSGTGVLFTRDPLSGAADIYGEWLPGGQGEDVVSGTHDPRPLAHLAETLPEVHAELIEAARRLEQEHADVQDIEFTVERGRLYLLQARSAKRSPQAAVRVAAELVAEGIIDSATALSRVSAEQVQAVLAPRLAPAVAGGAEVLARGVPACPGVGGGVAAPDVEPDATRPLVLVRPTTSPEDVASMVAAVAVVTERGGATSHAAVVTRALGCPSVVGVGDGVTAAWVGREVTVDGTSGVVYAGALPTEHTAPEDVRGLAEIVGWARERSPVAVAESEVPSGLEVRDIDAAGLRLEPDLPVDEDALHAALEGARAVSGTVLSTDAGVRVALACGVETVVPLPGQRPEVLLLRFAQAGVEMEQ